VLRNMGLLWRRHEGRLKLWQANRANLDFGSDVNRRKVGRKR